MTNGTQAVSLDERFELVKAALADACQAGGLSRVYFLAAMQKLSQIETELAEVRAQQRTAREIDSRAELVTIPPVGLPKVLVVILRLHDGIVASIVEAQDDIRDRLDIVWKVAGPGNIWVRWLLEDLRVLRASRAHLSWLREAADRWWHFGLP